MFVKINGKLKQSQHHKAIISQTYIYKLLHQSTIKINFTLTPMDGSQFQENYLNMKTMKLISANKNTMILMAIVTL